MCPQITIIAELFVTLLYNHQMYFGYGLAFHQNFLTSCSWAKINKRSPMKIEISGNLKSYSAYGEYYFLSLQS